MAVVPNTKLYFEITRHGVFKEGDRKMLTVVLVLLWSLVLMGVLELLWALLESQSWVLKVLSTYGFGIGMGFFTGTGMTTVVLYLGAKWGASVWQSFCWNAFFGGCILPVPSGLLCREDTKKDRDKCKKYLQSEFSLCVLAFYRFKEP